MANGNYKTKVWVRRDIKEQSGCKCLCDFLRVLRMGTRDRRSVDAE